MNLNCRWIWKSGNSLRDGTFSRNLNDIIDSASTSTRYRELLKNCSSENDYSRANFLHNPGTAGTSVSLGCSGWTTVDHGNSRRTSLFAQSQGTHVYATQAKWNYKLNSFPAWNCKRLTTRTVSIKVQYILDISTLQRRGRNRIQTFYIAYATHPDSKGQENKLFIASTGTWLCLHNV